MAIVENTVAIDVLIESRHKRKELKLLRIGRKKSLFAHKPGLSEESIHSSNLTMWKTTRKLSPKLALGARSVAGAARGRSPAPSGRSMTNQKRASVIAAEVATSAPRSPDRDELVVARGRHARVDEDLFHEALGGFEPGAAGIRSEDPQTVRPETVDQSRRERRLGSDNREVDAGIAREPGQPVDIIHAHIGAFSDLGDPGGSGRRMHAVRDGRSHATR